jgi:hypothetical protein
MTVGAYVVLRSMARRWRSGEVDLPSPYGPELATSAAGADSGDASDPSGRSDAGTAARAGGPPA